jgi:hypothetical protein
MFEKKEKYMVRRIFTTLCLLLCPLAAFGQSSEELTAFYKEQFAGWGGIVFRCLPDNETDQVQFAMCSAAAADARFLAATAKIPFEDLGNRDFFQVVIAARKLNSALIIESRIRSTQGQLRSVYMGLRAGDQFLNAVEKGAEQGSNEDLPRAGDLVLWERDVIASGGPENELRRSVSESFRVILTEFFGVFVESRN